jgi:hypothetical protein
MPARNSPAPSNTFPTLATEFIWSLRTAAQLCASGFAAASLGAALCRCDFFKAATDGGI